MSGAAERTFSDAVEWARTELSRADYGEVRVTFIVHAGRVSRVEKAVTVKEQPDEGRTDGRR